MTVQMLKGKIHRATVKQAELNYVGSITVDADLLDAAGIYEYEKVAIVDIENGNRFETYTIAGERGSGMICLNGAAARCVSVGDKVILMAYAQLTPEDQLPDQNHIEDFLSAVFDHPLKVRAVIRFGRVGTVNVGADHGDAVLLGVVLAVAQLSFNGRFSLAVR